MELGKNSRFRHKIWNVSLDGGKRLYLSFIFGYLLSSQNFKSSLNKVAKSLASSQDSREYLIKNTRDVIILCSRSIISAHKGDLASAKKMAQKANSLLITYRKKANSELKRYLVTPEQEFVEASSFLAIIENKSIPSVESLKVSDEAYVLGLMDLIGELKRYVFDNIRVGKSKEALHIFEIMEELYLQLYPFAMYDKILREARKKLDVNRKLVEDTRSVITEEVRRTHLIKSLNKINGNS